MKKTIIACLLFAGATYSAASQEDAKWEPSIHTTGYVNTVLEYSDHADTSVLGLPNSKHVGIGLGQIGLLTSYKPLENIEIKGTAVYSPWVRSWHDVLIEGYAAYTFSEKFKVGAGKYLTPLSPSNLYFYAPLNPSGVLPMVVSHHIFFPQSISGLQLSGSVGDDLKIDYNVTYGNFYITDHLESGVLGVQGQEEITPFSGHYEVYEGNRPESYLGGSGRLAIKYSSMLHLGLNVFEGTEYNLIVLDPATGGVDDIKAATQRSLGVDVHLDVKDIKLNAEYWTASGKTTDSDPEFSLDYDGYYAEVIYNHQVFQPWARYEYMNDAVAVFADGTEVTLPFVTYSAGLAYRPMYETTFKIEYRRVNVADYQDTGFPSSDFQDYNYLLASIVVSF